MATLRELEIYHFWVGHEQAPIDHLIDKFEWKFPIRVHRNAMEWGYYSMITKAKIMRGEPPDIMVYDIGQRIQEPAKSGELTDLTELWKEEDMDKSFPGWMKDASSCNGKVYGIPVKCFTYVVWYFKDVFQKHGIEPPTTWDEFLEVCKKFKRAGVSPVVASGWEVTIWFENILARIVGPKFYNRLMMGEESWTDPKVVEAYETLRDLAKEYFYPSPFSYSFRESWAAINNRMAGMQLQGDWVNGMWRRGYNYQPGRDFDYFVLPPLSDHAGSVMITGGNVWAVPSGARHVKDAKTFLKFAGSLEAQNMLASEGAGIVGRINVPKSSYDPLSQKLINDLKNNPTVLQMDALLPSSVASIENLQQMQAVLMPKLSRAQLKRLVSEIQAALEKTIKERK
ncbi:MAG: extracellular solute-binding protein [Candidatus Hadarchaeales archaeon]